jgi:PST family polysaccharide transporter
LARLLLPEDFGVMTAAMMVIAFSQIIWEAGTGKALIQRQNNIEEAANAAFIINIVLGLLVAGLLFICAKSITNTFFHDERVTIVLKVMTLQILLGALGSVHAAILQKEMGFKKLFWIRFATASLPGLVSVPFAINDYGYWALVVGSLIGQLVQVVMLWRISKWRPSLNLDHVVTKEISKFGAWVGGTGFFSWVFQWTDTLILGMFLGLHEVGIFRVGNQIATTIFALAFSFITPVLYSYLTNKKEINKLEIANEINKVFILVAIFSLPLGVVVFSIGDLFQEIILGELWVGVGYVVSLIAIKEAALWIFSYNIEAVRAIGMAKLETLVAGLSGLANIIVLYIFIHGGFESFMFGRSVVLMLVAIFIHLSIYLMVFGFINKSYKKILFYLLIYFILIIAIYSLKFFNFPVMLVISTGLFASIGFFLFLVFQNKDLVRLLVQKMGVEI